MKRGKRNIVWNKQAAPAPIERKRSYVEESDLTEETRLMLEQYLRPGELFMTIVSLETIKYPKHITPPPFVELTKHMENKWSPVYNKQKDCLIEAGSPIIYAGSVRVEEVGHQGSLRVLRHTFIVKQGRYIIRNLNHVRPVATIEPRPDAL